MAHIGRYCSVGADIQDVSHMLIALHFSPLSTNSGSLPAIDTAFRFLHQQQQRTINWAGYSGRALSN